MAKIKYGQLALTGAVVNGDLAGSIATAKLADGGEFVQRDGSVALTGNLPAGGNKITGLGTPTNDADAATKAYVDAAVVGLGQFKAPVRALVSRAGLAAYTQAGAGVGATLTADANGAIGAQDGVTLVADDRVLVWTSGGHVDDGIYVVTDPGDGSNPYVLTRALDADSDADVLGGAYVFVTEGTTYGDRGFLLTTNDDITVDTTAQVWSLFGAAAAVQAGAGLGESAGVFGVGDADKGVQVNADDLEIDASEIVGDGLKVGASSHLLAVDASAIAGAGLEDDGSENLRIASSAAGNGLTGGGGSALSVQANGASIDVGVSGVKAAVPVMVDKARNPSGATSGNEQDTGLNITKSPAGGYVVVKVNGISYEVGDGVKTKDCFFSSDGGTTARFIASIAAGDDLIWNGTVAGFDLATTDEIDLEYLNTDPEAS